MVDSQFKEGKDLQNKWNGSIYARDEDYAKIVSNACDRIL